MDSTARERGKNNRDIEGTRDIEGKRDISDD